MSHYFRLLFTNSLLALLISMLFFRTPAIAPSSYFGWFFTAIYLWSHWGLLALLITWPLGLFMTLTKASRASVSLLLFIFAFLQALLFVDTFVFQQYRFHINLFVLELLFKGQGQVISFPWYLWIAVGFLFVLLLLIQWTFHKKLYHPEPRGRTTALLSITIFLALISSHFVHMLAHASHNREITRIGNLPPFAAPLIDPKLAANLGIEVRPHNDTISLKTNSENSDLQYPLSHLNCEQKSDLNLLMIVLDSTRYDQLNPEVMPNTYKLKEKSIAFEKHYSGSNSTRGGIFSLFYGLPPLYFEKMRETKTGPVLIEQLLRHNYQFGLFSSAPLTMPEFNQTVFQAVPNLRLKSKAHSAIERDTEITRLGIDFLKNRNPNRPFFSFLFYDAPHEYAIHPDFLKFKPYWKAINYFALNNEMDPTEFLNLHHNSVHFVDSLIGKVLDELDNQRLLENTVVIFTSDHGQEFNDNKMNFWGHNSNFTDAQTQVPFIIYWPKRNSQIINHWTSHYDVPSTILEEFFECKNPSSDYSSGANLFKHSGHDWMIHGTYGDFAIRLKDHFIVVSLSGNYQILDYNYREKNNTNLKSDLYQKALQEMRRFYK